MPNKHSIGKHVWLSLIVGLLFPSFGWAVPISFQFQGHLVVDGVAFEGEGYFKFALLDADGDAVWSNDGSTGGGVVPATSVPLSLTRGVYTVLLGDSSHDNMAAIQPSVFDENTLALRVWFSSDDVTFEQLEPDTAIGAVAFAVRAATADTVTSLPDGIVESSHLSDDLKTALGLYPVLSTDAEDADLLQEGYTRGASFAEQSWSEGSDDGEPSARVGHVGFWTGERFVTWGGYAGRYRYLSSGSWYDPSSDEWGLLSSVNAPEGRQGHAGVFTGDSMIVWGGRNASAYFKSGGEYDLAANQWRPLSEGNAPEERTGQVSAWTGSALVVLGGGNGAGLLDSAGVYVPEEDVWHSLDFRALRSTEPIGTSVPQSLSDGSEGGNASNWRDGIDEDAPFFNGPQFLKVANGLAFVVTTSDDSLSVLDVSQPDAPSLIYSLLNVARQSGLSRHAAGIYKIDEMNAPACVEVSGDTIYVTSAPDGTVSIFDISDPSDLSRIGLVTDTDNGSDLHFFDRPTRVRLFDDLMVVGVQGRDGLSTTTLYFFREDLDNPGDPEFLSRIVTGNTIETEDGGTVSLDFGVGHLHFDAFGDYLYLTALAQPGLFVLNISDPENPKLKTHIDDGETGFDYLAAPRGVTISDDGTLLAIASSDDENAVTLVDVTVPGEPEFLAAIRDGEGDFEALAGPWSISIENHIMAVTGLDDNGLTLVDVGVPSDPQLIDQFVDGGAFSNHLDVPVAVDIDQETVYVMAGGADDALSTFQLDIPEPSPRRNAESVWTGDSLIVWGGLNDDPLGDGIRVAFADDGITPQWWGPISAVDAPIARSEHSAIWTGEEMLIWGGKEGGFAGFDQVGDFPYLADGGLYDPVADVWTPVSMDGAPGGRSRHVAVWTGTEMLVQGGEGPTGELADGFAYDPVGDTWRELSQEGSPLARSAAVADWADGEVIIFGGRQEGSPVGSLQKLNPEPTIYLYYKR